MTDPSCGLVVEELEQEIEARIPLDRRAPARARAASHAPGWKSRPEPVATMRDPGDGTEVTPSRRSVKRPVRPRDVLLVGSLAVALAACTGENVPSPVQRPTGAADLVIRVATVGAMLPPLEAERRLPEISIYGDGSVLVPAQGPEIPGPAGYDLESFHIGGERLDQIVTAAQSVGLRGPERRLEQQGPQFVADAGYTVVAIAADGAYHVTRAAALFDAPDGSQERQSLARFVADLRAVRAADPAPYQPIMLAVYVAAPDPGFQPDPASAQEVAWPFAGRLSTWGQPVPPIIVPARCAVVSGVVLETALPTLRAATSATVFVDAVGDRAIVAVRPLLPDEGSCDDASRR